MIIIDYYNEIKERLINNEIYSKVKDYSKERHKVITYFEIGKLLYVAGNKYGEDIIGNYSKRLITEVGKKYSTRTLRRMRQFYIVFHNEKWSTLSTKLTWSHYVEFLSLNDDDKMFYYLNISISNNISIRELREKIKNKEYERLPEKTRNYSLEKNISKIEDYIKSPIIIKNSFGISDISEKVLQRLILEDISSFMNELGEGFSFIDNEYKIKIGERYNYIDLLLYNIKYNCYVVVELKITELKKEHIGQIETYMNYIDKKLKRIDHDKTVGIIIVKKDNNFIMEYCSDSRIIKTTYKII